MSSLDASHESENLFALLAGIARRASDSRLVVAVCVGLLGVVAIAIVAPDWWRWTLPLLSLASFGTWGITDRVVRERDAAQRPGTRSRTALISLGWLAAVLGMLAALGSGLLFMAGALGTWIS